MNNFTPNQKKVFIVAIVIAVAIICYYVYGRNSNSASVIDEEEMLVSPNSVESEISDTSDTKIIVHIMGAVKNAGVVELNENSRVSDAIDKAGGLTDDADMSKINLAYLLEDGMKITIPSVNNSEEEEDVISTDSGEIVESETSSSSKSATSSLININRASQTELETLPGIGPSTALKIINYRDENGKFTDIEDIKNVSGIGDSKFANIKDLICVK
jgi:competence protein ComEA